MKRTSKKTMWIFAIGQLGWSILSGLISTVLINFYLPFTGDAENAADAMADYPFIYGGFVFLSFTIIGVITAFGRVFDAITDPLIANMSDGCRSKSGKRVPFLRYSAFPFALVTVLAFCCPVNGVSGWNVAWLAVMLVLFYLFMTAYCTPYNALIPVLGKRQDDRMFISTLISLTFLVGTGLAFTTKTVWEILANSTGLEVIVAARIVIAVLAFIAFICMLLPGICIKEKEFDDAPPVKTNAFKSLGKTFKNKQFRIFVLSDILYWIGITIFNTGFFYYVEQLLRLSSAWNTILYILMSVVALILYFPVGSLTKKFGKKKMVVTGFILFALAFVVSSLAGIVPINKVAYGFIIAILTGIPMAILGVVPQAIVADIAEADCKVTGENHDGMFYAARTFAFKLGQGVAVLIFTSLAVLGINGYRWSLIIAIFFAIGGAVALCFYNERKVMDIILPQEEAKEEISNDQDQVQA